MSRYFSVVVVVAYLLSSINGLLPLRHVPHDHLLLGVVTAAQLRAHEAAEAQETDSVAAPQPSGMAITTTGGIILSLPQNANAIASVHPFEATLSLVLILIAPLTIYRVLLPAVLTQLRFLPVFDPPPRFHTVLA